MLILKGEKQHLELLLERMMEYKLKEIKIEVTHRCSLSCIHCSSSATNNSIKNINKEKCIEIINSTIGMGVKKIAFSGGEPLLWEPIYDCISLATSKSIEVILYSSGNIDNMAEASKNISKTGVTKVIFSLYSDIPIEHNRITRKVDSFDKTLSAINLLNKAGIKTEIHFVALKNNYSKLARIVDLANNNGVNSISVLRFVPQGRGSLIKSQILDRHDNLELKKQIEELRKNNNRIRTGSPWNFLFLNSPPECLSAIDRMIISPDLDIFPCDAFKGINKSIFSSADEYSNIKNHSVEDCWKYSYYFNYIREKKEDYCKKCTECVSFSLCNSGCIAQKCAFDYTNIKSPDPSCLLG
jgi:radical SAM protein with 4Fe4S-binding SPASM domain